MGLCGHQARMRRVYIHSRMHPYIWRLKWEDSVTAFAQMSPPQATTRWLCLGLYRPWGIGLLSSSTETCRLSFWARSCQASGIEKFCRVLFLSHLESTSLGSLGKVSTQKLPKWGFGHPEEDIYPVMFCMRGILAPDETSILVLLSVMARVLQLDSNQDSSQHSFGIYLLEFIASHNSVDETELSMTPNHFLLVVLLICRYTVHIRSVM